MLLLHASGRTGLRRGGLMVKEGKDLWRFAQWPDCLGRDDIDTNTCIPFFKHICDYYANVFLILQLWSVT